MAARQKPAIIRTDRHRTIGLDVVKGAVDWVHGGDPAFIKGHRLAQIEPDQIGDRHNGVETGKK